MMASLLGYTDTVVTQKKRKKEEKKKKHDEKGKNKTKQKTNKSAYFPKTATVILISVTEIRSKCLIYHSHYTSLCA